MAVTIRGSGQSIVQVQSTLKTNGFSFTTGSATPVDITGLSVNITPYSTNNKILVILQLTRRPPTGGGLFVVNLVRNSTLIAQGTDDYLPALSDTYFGTITGPSGTGQFNTREINTGSGINFLDSPNTTSQITYKAQGLMRAATPGTAYVNYWSVSAGHYAGVSSITALEISGD